MLNINSGVIFEYNFKHLNTFLMMDNSSKTLLEQAVIEAITIGANVISDFGIVNEEQILNRCYPINTEYQKRLANAGFLCATQVFRGDATLFKTYEGANDDPIEFDFIDHLAVVICGYVHEDSSLLYFPPIYADLTFAQFKECTSFFETLKTAELSSRLSPKFYPIKFKNAVFTKLEVFSAIEVMFN